MDRSFQSSFSYPFSSKSPFSIRSRQSLSSQRIVPPSFRKSSRFSVSGKSVQPQQIIIKSPYNFVEHFGQPLPVLITEALTFADRNTVITAKVAECGYAWVVCGRRLLIWQYRQTLLLGTPHKKLTNQCFELQLPQSDLAHRAELVSVFNQSSTNTPSCIAVSPEGVVRYWPSIQHEGITVEHSVDLQGQECDTLTDVEGLGCILATTTCTIVLVQPKLNNGRHTLCCKQLKTPSGWLGGISKKMSSLIFGPISSEQSNETRLVRVLTLQNNSSSWTVYVLAGHSLQKWILAENEPEQLVFVAELNRSVRDAFHSAVWDKCVGDETDIDTWLLDIQSDKDNVILLAAAVNMQLSPQVHYAMISIPTSESNPSNYIRDILLLKISGLYREDNPSDSLSYRFLLGGTNAYLYNLKTIIVIKPQEEPDLLEFSSAQDFLLCGLICVNTPVFFSRVHGLVAVAGNDSSVDLNLSVNAPGTPIETSFNESIVANNLSVYNMDPEEIYNAHSDTLGQLKSAFIFHLSQKQAASQEIINKLFPNELSATPEIDGALDKVVVAMNKDLLDDIPASDPRWSKDCPPGIGSSYSMQVLHQLEDKQRASLLFLRFLKDSGLWNKLTAVTMRGVATATASILAEHSEKIVAAIAMKSLPNSLILENAIEKAIEDYETEPKNSLTNQDIFYREVSKVHKGIQELVNSCEDSAHSDIGPPQLVQMVHDTNEIVLTVLNEVVQYRHQNAERFFPSDAANTLKLEYLPWTGASGSQGLGDYLLTEHNLTYTYGLKLVSESQLRNSLLDHFVALTDLILDSRKCHLDSIKNSSREKVLYRQYCSDRFKFIQPLLQEKEWERAAQLAEKYLDFETLILICELTDNPNRLDEYMARFESNGFSEYAYNWFLKENKQGKLIDRYRKVGKSKPLSSLSSFLSDHPSLKWMQQIFDGNFNSAADTLKQLATDESESVTRQKTMWSLSKLSKLAGVNMSDTDEFLKNVNSHIDLITFQEDLPDYVLQKYGYDTLKPRVIPPKDLVSLYISSEYIDATELEFKKALDILPFIDDEDVREELSLKIWRSAILRDSWNFKNLDSPLEILQNTLFFRLVDIALALGANPQNLLPPLELLTEDSSLDHLNSQDNFQFLLKTGYEHVYRTQMLE